MDLNNWGIRQAMQPAPVQSRISLSPNELGFASASYFNGRDFERHQEAKSEYTYVKSVFVVHVGGTRCVTSSTDNNMNIHARITLNVECIRTCIFIFLFDV
jgi:hypothetical protein